MERVILEKLDIDTVSYELVPTKRWSHGEKIYSEEDDIFLDGDAKCDMLR